MGNRILYNLLKKIIISEKDCSPGETLIGMSENPSFPSANFSSDPSVLPDDPAVLNEMMRTMAAEYEQVMAAYKQELALVAHLQHQLELHLRHRFGRRSETMTGKMACFRKKSSRPCWRRSGRREKSLR